MSKSEVDAGDGVHPGKPVIVDRYTVAARINHWITAISLVLLALSGLALFTPALYFLTGLFGGGATTRMIHPWIGVVLFVSFRAVATLTMLRPNCAPFGPIATACAGVRNALSGAMWKPA